jgi:hypothetical protein
MDAAGAVDAENAPHRALENRTERGFPQRPHAPSFGQEKKRRSKALIRLTHKNPDTPRSANPLLNSKQIRDFLRYARRERRKQEPPKSHDFQIETTDGHILEFATDVRVRSSAFLFLARQRCQDFRDLVGECSLTLIYVLPQGVDFVFQSIQALFNSASNP